MEKFCSKEDREKSELLMKLAIIKRHDKNLDIPNNEELSKRNTKHLRKLFTYFNGGEHKKDKIILEKISKEIDERFKEIDTNPYLFGKDNSFPTEITVEDLLKIKPEYIIKFLGNEVDSDLPIQTYFLDKIRNVIYLVYKFLLILMEFDGYSSLEDVIMSKHYNKYLEIKHILFKYSLLHCHQKIYVDYLKKDGRYKYICESEHVSKFREFVADETFSNIPYCPIS